MGKYYNASQCVRKNQQERSVCEQKKIHTSAMMRHATTGIGMVFFGNGFGKAKIPYLCDEGFFVTQAPQAIARAERSEALYTLAIAEGVQSSQKARTPYNRSTRVAYIVLEFMVSVYATIQKSKKNLEARAVGVERSGTPMACKTCARNSRPKIFLQFKKVR